MFDSFDSDLSANRTTLLTASPGLPACGARLGGSTWARGPSSTWGPPLWGGLRAGSLWTNTGHLPTLRMGGLMC